MRTKTVSSRGLALLHLAGLLAVGSIVSLSNASAATSVPAAAPVCPDASPEARMLLKYLQEQFGHKILSAQHGGPTQYEYVHQVTGKYAAMWGTDLIDSRRNDRLVSDVVGWWEKGVIPSIMWHWGAPTKGEGYEQSKMTIDVNRCFEPGTPENVAMWADLKRIADDLTKLRDAHVPVVWRPMHEGSGGWFWYDKSGGEAFKRLWITMFDYFSKERGLNNLLWVLGQDGCPDAAYNPGSDYYDIIGTDTYDGKKESHLRMFEACQEVDGHGKPICFHECGTPPDPEACRKDGAMWSWFMVWYSHVSTVDPAYLKTVYESDLVITLDELPRWSELLQEIGNRPHSVPGVLTTGQATDSLGRVQ